MFKRIPKLDQLGQVFAVILIMVYAWTIKWFFWKLGGWLFYLQVVEILTIFNYTATVNLIESVVVLLALIGLCVVLPQKWFSEKFSSRGTALVISALGYLMYVASLFQRRDEFPQAYILRLSIPVLVGILVLVFLVGRVSFLRKIMEEIANRASIFLYVLLPIGLLSALIVLVRNLI